MDWSLAGIPRGIPERTNIFVNVRTTTNAKYRCAGDGVADDTTALAAAITDCPADQVVFLPQGTYRITKKLYFPWKSRVVIRGEGPSKTVLIADSMADTVINFGSADWPGPPATQVSDIVSGAVKGSTNILVQNSAPFTPGALMCIDQLNTDMVNNAGMAGGSMWDRNRDGKRTLQQIVRITGVAASQVTFWPPLHWTHTSSPQAAKLSFIVSHVGIEDLKITSKDGAGLDHIEFTDAYQCWIKNVWSDRVRSRHIFLVNCLQCEIQGCRISKGQTYQVGAGYGIEAWTSHSCLIQNNILDTLWASMIIAVSSSGNVIGYNFITNTVIDSGGLMGAAINACHGSHPMMNLFEGNVGSELQSDFYYGSSSHLTLFRNYFLGTDNRVQQNRKAVSFDMGSVSNNVVGNVLGSPGLNWAYEMPPGGSYSDCFIYRLGFPNMGNNGGTPDPAVANSILRHGNYDYANKSVVWAPGIPDQTLPNSLYLSEKPAWWGESLWPPVQPLQPLVVKIPAQIRFDGVTLTRPAAAPILFVPHDHFGGATASTVPVGADKLYVAQQFTAGSSYRVSRLVCRLAASAQPAPSLRAAVYSNDNGKPGALLGTISDPRKGSDLTAAESDVNFSGIDASLTAGASYWLVLMADSQTANPAQWSLAADSDALAAMASPDGTTWSSVGNAGQRSKFTLFSR